MLTSTPLGRSLQRNAERVRERRNRFVPFFDRFRSPGILLAAGFLVLYLVLAWYLHIWREIWIGDAVSRTANGTYVVLSRDPHLGAVGFVWPPGLSIIQIPFILLLDPFRQSLFAGNMMSAILTAATLWAFWKLLEALSVPTPWALAMVILYATNPMTLYYASNGESESTFMFLVIVVIWQFFVYTRARHYWHLFACALALAAAVWVRYETIPVTAAVAIALALYEIGDDEQGALITRTEAVLLTAIGPASLSFVLWLFFNLLIQGDVFYWVNSPGGPIDVLATKLSDHTAEARAASTSLPLAAIYSLRRIALLSPFFLPITAVATAIALKRRNMSLVGVLGIGSSVLVFAVYLLGTGRSFGWLRFYIYALPLTIVFGTAAAYGMRRQVRRALYAVVIVGLVVAIPSTSWAMWNPDTGPEEGAVLLQLSKPRGQAEVVDLEHQIADYLDNIPADRIIYVGTYNSYPIIPLVRHRNRLVITNDADHGLFLDDPIRKLDYLLVPSPKGLGQADELHARFPDIYEFGEPWLEREKEWTSSRSPGASTASARALRAPGSPWRPRGRRTPAQPRSGHRRPRRRGRPAPGSRPAEVARVVSGS